MSGPLDAIRLVPWLLIFATLTLTMSSLWRMHLSVNNSRTMQIHSKHLLRQAQKINDGYPWKDDEKLEKLIAGKKWNEEAEEVALEDDPEDGAIAPSEEGTTATTAVQQQTPATDKQEMTATALPAKNKKSSSRVEQNNDDDGGDTTPKRERGSTKAERISTLRSGGDGLRIAVVMHSLRPSFGGNQLNLKWLYNLAYTNHKQYCDKWGYDFIVEDEEDVSGMDRDVSWAKVLIMKKWLSDSERSYDWVLYVDQTVFFQKFEQSVPDMIAGIGPTGIAGAGSGVHLFVPRNPIKGASTAMMLARGGSAEAAAFFDDWFNVAQRHWQNEEVSALAHLQALSQNKQRTKRKGGGEGNFEAHGWLKASISITYDAQIFTSTLGRLDPNYKYNKGSDFAVVIEGCLRVPAMCRRTAINYYTAAASANGLGKKSMPREIPTKVLPPSPRGEGKKVEDDQQQD